MKKKLKQAYQISVDLKITNFIFLFYPSKQLRLTQKGKLIISALFIS